MHNVVNNEYIKDAVNTKILIYYQIFWTKKN